jgi:hypothetical protein
VKSTFEQQLIEILCDNPRKAIDSLRKGMKRDAQLFGDRLHVVVGKESGDLEQVRAELKSQGITIQSSRTIPPSLEDVFISRISS